MNLVRFIGIFRHYISCDWSWMSSGSGLNTRIKISFINWITSSESLSKNVTATAQQRYFGLYIFLQCSTFLRSWMNGDGRQRKKTKQFYCFNAIIIPRTINSNTLIMECVERLLRMQNTCKFCLCWKYLSISSSFCTNTVPSENFWIKLIPEIWRPITDRKSRKVLS